jgi:hypothetical protein
MGSINSATRYDNWWAATGIIVWIPVAVLTAWHEALLLLAPLLIVPLSVGLIGDRRRRPALAMIGSAAAIGLAISFLLGPGWTAAMLAAPWLVVTVMAAAVAVRDIRPHGGVATTGGLVAQLFLPIGATWALASRLGLEPMGFREPIVLLTAVHFHYAGFVLPIVTGYAAAAHGGRLGRVALAGVAVGVPLVAIGITVGGWVEWLAAWLQATVAVTVAGLHMAAAARPGPTVTRMLWAVAGWSLLGSMRLVFVYGRGGYLGQGWLTIPQMVTWHGTLNVLGFALPAVLGWRYAANIR